MRDGQLHVGRGWEIPCQQRSNEQIVSNISLSLGLLYYNPKLLKLDLSIQHGDQEGVGGRDKESRLESGGGKIDRQVHDPVDTRDQVLGPRDGLRIVHCPVELLGHRPVPHPERVGHDEGEIGAGHGVAKGELLLLIFFPSYY